jgi:hypothetical protein
VLKQHCIKKKALKKPFAVGRTQGRTGTESKKGLYQKKVLIMRKEEADT